VPIGVWIASGTNSKTLSQKLSLISAADVLPGFTCWFVTESEKCSSFPAESGKPIENGYCNAADGADPDMLTPAQIAAYRMALENDLPQPPGQIAAE
jgi:hypothetical protein